MALARHLTDVRSCNKTCLKTHWFMSPSSDQIYLRNLQENSLLHCSVFFFRVNDLGMDLFKIGSAEVTRLDLLEEVKSNNTNDVSEREAFYINSFNCINKNKPCKHLYSQDYKQYYRDYYKMLNKTSA